MSSKLTADQIVPVKFSLKYDPAIIGLVYKRKDNP